MKQFGAFKAKTHFSELLESVMHGEKFIITKHGVPAALLIPFTKTKSESNPVKNAIRALKKGRKGVTLGKKLTIRKLIDEGRR